MTQVLAKRNLYLRHVEALNFELTYRCKLNCNHCQIGDKKEHLVDPRLTEAAVKRIITEAKEAGIIKRGFNFSGGESLLYRPDIFRLVNHVRSVGKYVRMNTSGIWGGQTNIPVGGRVFSTSQEVVKALRAEGLTLLAVSLDGLESTHDRRRGLTGLFGRAMQVIEDCQRESLPVRILSTGTKDTEKEELVRVVTAVGLGVNDVLKKEGSAGTTFCGLGFVEQVDVGRAADMLPLTPPQISYDNALLAQPSLLCHGKGFARPKNLHIAPNGNVRTCNFALAGMANLGNAIDESLMTILQRFPSDHVSQTFADHIYRGTEAMTQAAGRLFLPEVYKGFAHPCTALAVIARLLQAESAFGGKPSTNDLMGFNIAVAKSLNLFKI